ncbi:Fasciclin domain-containing protein [Haloarchaeobius iranensis]|uniref:Fasciclin domain-containing protein n=1 Tax=Haloarchaeobius iranensis TaxID=996166 RepID=A0A1G9ZFW8_9EURY|nr:Fasciclin domain-containing protein [Haloarchaeobius iranensis]
MTTDRRAVLRSLAAGTALLAGGAGTAAAGPPRDGDTIVDVAVSADGFDTLVAAVAEAGLVGALDGNRQLTVFAPTDEAFAAVGITPDNVGDVDDEFLLRTLA